MGISTFPAQQAGIVLTKKKVTGNYSVPSDLGAVPVYQTSGTLAGGTATKYANNIWVAIHPGGRIITSTDRLTWNYLHNNLLEVMSHKVNNGVAPYRATWSCKSLDYGDGKWMAYFSNSLLLSSTDLVTWTVVLDLSSNTSELGTGAGLNKTGTAGCVVWNGTANLWMLVNTGKFVFTSANGTTWTERSTEWATAAGATAVPNKVAWANQLFIIVDSIGQIVTSADGIAFTLRTAVFGGSAANDIASNGAGSNASATTIIVAAAGKWAYSTNGTTWTANTTNGTKVHTNAIWDGSRFVINTTTAAEAYYSTNGQGGLALTATPTGLTAGVALGQQLSTDGTGKVCAMTLTGFITSADVTVSWATFSTITALGSNENPAFVVNQDTKKFSCVDGNEKIWLTQGRLGKVFVSTDGGTTWSFNNSDLTSFTNTTVANNITITGFWYLNGLLFAADNNAGLRVSSNNGTTWGSRITGFTGGVAGMAYGNGVYIIICPNAVGASSTTSVFRSTDGTSWTAIASGSTGGATSKLFYNGTVVAYDTFIPRTLAFDSSPTGGFFEIIADAQTGNQAVVTRSRNGIYWVDGLAGTGTSDYISWQVDINPAVTTPGSTTTVSYSATREYAPGTTGPGRGGLLVKAADDKQVLFIRNHITASSYQGFLVFRNSNNMLGTRNYYQACKVNGPAIFLNPESPTIDTTVGQTASSFEPIYLNYHPNIGWVAVYFVTNNSLTSHNYILVSSADGITWDFVASIPTQSSGQDLPFVFTNEVDKVFISLVGIAATGPTDSFYTFPISTVASNV